MSNNSFNLDKEVVGILMHDNEWLHALTLLANSDPLSNDHKNAQIIVRNFMAETAYIIGQRQGLAFLRRQGKQNGR